MADTVCQWWYFSCYGADPLNPLPPFFKCTCNQDPLHLNDPPQDIIDWVNALLDLGGPCNQPNVLRPATGTEALSLGECGPTVSPQWWCIKCNGGDGTCTYYCGVYNGVAEFFALQNRTGGLFDPSVCPGGYTIVPLTSTQIQQANLGICGLSPDPNSVIQDCNGRISIKIGGKICRCGHYGPHPSGSHIPPKPSGFQPSGFGGQVCPACGTSILSIPQYVDVDLPAGEKDINFANCVGLAPNESRDGNGNLVHRPLCGIVPNVYPYGDPFGGPLLGDDSMCSVLAGSYRLWWVGLWVRPSGPDPTAGCCYRYDFNPPVDCYAGGSPWWHILCCLGTPISVVAYGGPCCGSSGFGDLALLWTLFATGATYNRNGNIVAIDPSATTDYPVNCVVGSSHSLPSNGHTGNCCRNGSQDPGTQQDIPASGAPCTVTIGEPF